MATINSTINKLIKFKSKYNKLADEIGKELADYAKEQIEEDYQSSPFQEENGDRKTEVNKEDKTYIVKTSGSQVLYTEFGTGTVGENNPHPEKSKYNLNPYNYATIEHGGTIRVNSNKDTNASKEGIPVGGLYWTYKDKEGNKVYTQGIPAGKQVYNAKIKTEKKAKEIAKRKVADLLSKL